MKFRNIFFITIILLAILSISAVSAADDLANDDIVNVDSDSDIVSVDEDTSVEGVGDSSIVSDDLTIYYKNGTKYQATFFDFDGNPIVGQDVTFSIVGQNYTRATDENGIARLAINLASGNYTINVTNPVTNESVVNNIFVLSTMNSSDLVKYYKNGTKYEVKVLDGQGNPLNNTSVEFNIIGQIYNRVTDENGIARLAINLAPGEYVISAKSSYNGDTVSNNITVLPTIEGKNIELYYKNGTKYEVNVIDGQGNPLANETVTFNILGQIYNRVTDENGTARLGINLAPGKYVISAKSSNNGDTVSNNITVLSTIVTKDIKLYYQNGTKYEVKVLDGQGNPLNNTTVELNIIGQIYNRTTDENGTARLAINLAPGTYVITAKNPLTGELASSKIQVLSRIVAKNSNGGNISMEYLNGKYTVELHEKNGSLAVNKSVSFNILGQVYNRTSNENGTASLNINLLPGNYVITAEYDGCKQSNLLKVRITPSIKVITTTVKSGDYIQFRLTEKNSGNPITGNHLGIVGFNESYYGVYPDSTGLCKIRAYLPAGSYLFIFATLDDGWYSSLYMMNTIKFIE